MKRASLFFLSLSLVLGCAKSPRSSATAEAPELVDTKQVQTVGMATSKAMQLTCEKELTAAGAAVLYSGEMGLMLTNRKASELSLSKCTVNFSENAELDLPRGAARNDVDLSTLLRLIPAEEIGARSFVKNNPTFDGRTAVIGILDTGVEVDHPMLRKTSTGEDKVIDFHDMSGEGRVLLTPADPASVAFPEGATEVQFGTYPGSLLKYSEDIAAKDTFADVGVITYLAADGKRRARIDTNNDKAFGDEKELADYAETREFTKLGEKKSLTTSVKITPDGKMATLCFDDGTHGTHVAGIAAGYDAEGLQGVAPGAKIVGVKIGDNRLSGGSTTTASMLLAIDYAVAAKVHVINLSYGIRSGSNIGKSAIDQYVDKVAKEKGILFAISAGNEGPGLLTTGTPAGADLAITNAAYVSKETAKENYGYVAVEDDNTWYFSSVGPRLDGGWKPTLLAPGSALSAVPPWAGGHANYRGTSMASPQVTGGLALLLSAALQSGLPTDRATVTQAVYRSATLLPSLALVEQGHGLMNVNKALEVLTALKGTLPVEYLLRVNSPTAPGGKGSGIYVRSRNLPDNVFNVTVMPDFPVGTSDLAKDKVKTFKLVPSADWIKVPPTLWVTSAPRVFQVELNLDILKTPGLHSARIQAVEESTGRVAFDVPVTVVSPSAMNESNAHIFQVEPTIKVGQTLRYFVDVPAGTTSLAVNLSSDGPFVWGQLLNSEGRKVAELRDSEASVPLAPIYAQANITRPGVYELDVVAPANNARRAKVQLKIQAFSLTASAPVFKPGKGWEFEVQNNFEPVKVVPKAEVTSRKKVNTVEITGGGTEIPFTLSDADKTTYSEVRFTVNTAKEYYDLMTDYPFRVFDPEKGLVIAGGLELTGDISVGLTPETKAGSYLLEIQGAFTQIAPASWGIELIEDRILAKPEPLFTGPRTLLETGQSVPLAVNAPASPEAAYQNCAVVTLSSPRGDALQTFPVCR